MSALHSEHWILRKIYDIQREMVQIRFTMREVVVGLCGGIECPNLYELLNNRLKQLEEELIKYDKITEEYHKK